MSEPRAQPPDQFGHEGTYRVVGELGRGGFATVYKAYHASLDRHVAIKVLRPELVQDETGLQRFQREARAAARLGGHPHIVTIYDYGEQDGRAYLVLEYIEGMTLEQRLKEPLPIAEVPRIVNAVASALDFAHRHQLIHRDVKPANVLLGKDGRVVLSDFGIAKLLDSATSLTGLVVGTPEYMAPEQVTGAPVDARTDIYALGVLVYRLIAGRPPFEAAWMTVLHKQVYEPPPPMARSSQAVPPEIDEVVAKALAKDPADRHGSAGELAAAVERALRPALLREQARAAEREPETLVGGAVLEESATSAVTMAGAPAASMALDDEPPTPVPRPRPSPIPPAVPPPAPVPGPPEVRPREASQSRRLVPALAVLGLLLLVGGGFVGLRLFRGEAPPVVAPTVAPATIAPIAAPGTVTPPAGPPTSIPSKPAPTSVPAAAKPAVPTMVHPSTGSGQVTTAAPTAVAPRVAPAMGTARNLHTATVLDNGKLLVVGGKDGNTTLATAELYDRSTNAWTPAGTMATVRNRHSATLLPGGKVLVVGGQSSDAAFVATAELYDPAASIWTPAGTLAAARADHTATLLDNGKVLVAGGYNAGRFHNTAELYDPESTAWSPAANMADVHSGHTATLLPGGDILVVGGFGTSSQATAERYALATNTWTSAGSMSEGRFDHVATSLPNGKVLVSGGVNSTGGGTYLASAELFDPAANRWSGVASMAGPRSGHAATPLSDGRVLVAGGRDTTSSLATAELYDPAANAWTSAGALAAARWLPTAASLPDGRVVLAGGRVGNSSFASVEEYDAASNNWESERLSIKMELTSQNNSGITGIATFTDLGGGKLKIEIHANGAGAGPQPAHIHEGSCTQLNPAPKYPLGLVTNGDLVSELDTSIQEITSAPHAIHMHKSAEEMPVYVACADTRVPG